MLKIIAKISLVLFLAAAPFLYYGFGAETLKIVSRVSLRDSRWLSFAAGVIIFFPCMWAGKRIFPNVWAYMETLEHELTHLLIGLLFLKIPTGIRVSAHEGGEVRQIGLGTTGQTWVSLAPYFFPTVSLAVLIVAYFFAVKTVYLLALLGWTTAFHLISNWGETSFRQPDLQKVGILKSILILPIMNIISYGSILAFVAGGGKDFSSFWHQSLASSLSLFWKIFR